MIWTSTWKRQHPPRFRFRHHAATTFHRHNAAVSTAFAVTHVSLFRKIKAQPRLQIATAGLFDSCKFLQMLCSKHEVFPQSAAAASLHHCWENLSWSSDSRMSHYFSDEFRISSATATAATLGPWTGFIRPDLELWEPLGYFPSLCGLSVIPLSLNLALTPQSQAWTLRRGSD